MSRLIDETGKRYGRLTILRLTKKKSIRGRYWQCQCDCGKLHLANTNLLHQGKVKSCGCMQGSKTVEILPADTAAVHQLIRNWKSRCTRSHRRWALSEKQVRRLTKQNCHYCGAPPRQLIGRSQGYRGNYVYNGLDRISPKRGYVLDNVVPCCGTCNFGKHTQTQEEFKKWIKAVSAHWAGK